MPNELCRQQFRVIIELEVVVDDIDSAGSAACNGRGAPQGQSSPPAVMRNLERQRQLLHVALQDPGIRSHLLREEVHLQVGEALRDLDLTLDHVSDDEGQLAPALAQLDRETQLHFRRAFARDYYAELDSFWSAIRVDYREVRVEEVEPRA